ncbi:MAG: glycosyltransferase, partial [Planctomycetota bacterium]|nr:glycosyltransferase [Planctomycetota bacterium]
RGLERVLVRHSAKLGGILNGIDYEVWNPATDQKLAVRYSDGENFFGKYGNKKALRDWLGLREDWRPIVSAVTRLTRQKGLDLIKHAVFATLERQGQFVLLGSAPDKRIGDDFNRLQYDLRDNPDARFYLGYHEDLSHLIYAGSDLFLVPSLYEPCGLTQMISLRYGTVPVVRETGGLNDSVFDVDTSSKGLDGVNGFTFRDPTPTSLDYALNRAIRMWYDNPDSFNRVIRNGMRCDYSWREPARHYENIYHYVKA